MKTRVRFVYLGFSAVILGCFGFLPAMQAVSPAPDGAYSDLNTAEGQSALEHLIFGPWLEGLNTAIGWEALFSNAHGHSNTPNGGAALHNDTTGISNTDCRGRCKDRFASDHARRGGKPETVRYEAINAMLLNEFLKEHRQVQEQREEIDVLKAELKTQRALIQKVSDKIERNNRAPEVASTN